MSQIFCASTHLCNVCRSVEANKSPSDEDDAEVEGDEVFIPARQIRFLEEDELDSVAGGERQQNRRENDPEDNV